MKAGYFIFEKGIDANAEDFQFKGRLNTLSELRRYLNDRLKDGLKAEDFLIIRGTKHNITAVKIVAEFETAEPEPTRG